MENKNKSVKIHINLCLKKGRGIMGKRKAKSRIKLETTQLWKQITAIAVVVAIFLHIFAGNNGLYHITNIDIITHFASAFALTAVILNFDLPLGSRDKWLILIVLAPVFGMAWEFLELYVDWFGSTSVWDPQPNFFNSVQDIFMDVCGCIAALFFYEKGFGYRKK